MKSSLERYSAPIVTALVLICAWLWAAAVGYEGLNGQDGHDYLRMAQAWSSVFEGGEPPVMVEHPHGYPLLGALLAKLVGSELLALRLMSATALLLIAELMVRVLRNTGASGTTYRWWPLFGLALAPFLLRQSLTVMSDMSAISLCVAAFAHTLRWQRSRRAGPLLVAVVCFALAVSFRLAAVPFAFLTAMWCVVRWLGVRKGGALLLLSLVVVMGALVLSSDTLKELLDRLPLGDWSVLNMFDRVHQSDDGTLYYLLPNIVRVWAVFVHPGFMPLGVALLAFVRREDLRAPHVQLALLSIAGYLLFVAGMPYQNDRVLLMAQPFVWLVLAPAFERAYSFALRTMPAIKSMIALLLVALVGLCWRAVDPFATQAARERYLVAAVCATNATRIYTHGMGAACGTYCPRLLTTELWYGKIGSFEPGALVLINPADLAAQWQGTPPGINWENVQRQGLSGHVALGGGWVLARVR